MLLLILLISSAVSIVASNPECLRYHMCISAVRNDYEQCIGGVGAALVGDYESAEEVNRLLRHSNIILDCEKESEHFIKELKVIRQLESEDILKCIATSASNVTVSEIRKIACAGTPIPWSLQELAKNVLRQPSHCHELYLLQLERCAFIRDCCLEHSECMSNVSNNSLAHDELNQRSHSLSELVKKCLLDRNTKYDNLQEEGGSTEGSAVPSFKLSAEEQRIRIQSALRDTFKSTSATSSAASSITTLKTQTTVTPSTLFPTLPTLPPLPNVFAILFPTTTTTTPQPKIVASSSMTTPKSEFNSDGDDVYAAVHRIHLNESDVESYCFEMLRSESELMRLEIECTLKRSINFTDEDLWGMMVHADILKNSMKNSARGAVRQACELPINTALITELTQLIGHLEMKRMECVHRGIHYPNTILSADGDECDSILMQALNESDITTQHQSANLASDLAQDYSNCEEKIASAKHRFTSLKRCCPNSKVCEEVMQESEPAQLYKRVMGEVGRMQRDCDSRTTTMLKAQQTGFIPFAQ